MSVLIMQAGLLARSGKRPIDPDAQAIYDMLTTPISSGQLAVLSNAIKYIKGANPWARNTWQMLDMLAMWQHMPTKELALIDWKRKVIMQELGTPVFTSALGFDGAGAGAIDSLWVPMQVGDNYAASDASFGVAISKPFTGASSVWGGTNRGNRILIRSASSTVRVSGHINTSSSTTHQPVAPTDAIAGDILHVAREAGSVQRVYKNGILVASGGSAISSNAFTEPVYLLAQNGSGSYGHDGAAAFFWGGASLTASDYNVLAGVRAILATMPA